MKKVLLFASLFCFVGTSLFAQVRIQQTGTKSDAAQAANEQKAKKNAKDIRNVIENYNNFNKSLQKKYTEYEEALPPYIISGNYAYQLVKKTHDLTKESSATTDILAVDYSNIYPGAVIYVDGELAGGRPRLVGLDPGKVTVSVDFNPGSGCISKVEGVVNKASSVYQDGIYKILNGAKNPPAVDFAHKYKYASSANELSWSLGVDANFLKNTVKVNTSSTSKQSTLTEVDDWTQKYYTVKCDWESDPSKYFGPNVTGEQLQNKIEKNGPIGIITSVTYGRRAYIFKDVKSTYFKFHGDQNVNVYGQSASSTQDLIKNAKDSSVWMWVAGTDAGSAIKMLEGKNLRTAIKKCVKYNKDTNQGTPLYYTVKILGSNRTVNVQPAGTYTTVEYVPMPKYVSCTFKNNAFVIAGGGIKMRVDYKVVKIDKDGNKVDLPKAKDALAGYTRFIEYGMDKGDKKTFDLKIKEGEFLDGPVRVQLRQKRHATGKWYNSVVTKVYPKDCELVIVSDGSVRPDGKDLYIHKDSKLIYAKDQN